MALGIAELLNRVSNLKRTQEKIDMLRANDSFALRVVLQAIYDPNIKFLLPEGVPPYTPSKLVDQENVLHHDARYIRYFIDGWYPNMKQLKRETMFIEFLERLAPKDAELICQVKDKKPLRGITTKHIQEGLPGLLPNEQA